MTTQTLDTKIEVDVRSELVAEASAIAAADGVTLDHLVGVALAGFLAARRDERYLKERAARGNPERALELLAKAGRNGPVVTGDEIP
jgi:hypothetical protein